MDTNTTNSTSTVTDTQNKIQYAKKITLDEFNKQKDEYTQNALKELNEIMKMQVNPRKKIHKNSKIYTSNNNGYGDGNDDASNGASNDGDSNDGDSNNSDSNDDDNSNGHEINFIGKYSSSKGKGEGSSKNHGKNHGKKHDTTVHNTDTNAISMNATATILAKHEKDNKLISGLKQQKHNLEDEINNLDSKLHYMKLDLNNLQVENNELKKTKSKLLNDNKILDARANTLEKQVNYYKQLQFLYKWLIVLLVILLIVY